jgi:hypothetical protein
MEVGKAQIALVASASYMQGSGFGADIDSHEIVVRLNTGFMMCDKYPDDVGIRTSFVYMNNKLKRSKLAIPAGSKPMYKKHVIPDTREYGKYESNTGVLAVVDLCLQGYTIKVYGFDFYSPATGGIIQEEASLRNRDVVPEVPRELVFMDGYDAYLGPTHKLGHVGGMRDFRIFMQMVEEYNVQYDSFLAEIIAKNISRI